MCDIIYYCALLIYNLIYNTIYNIIHIFGGWRNIFIYLNVNKKTGATDWLSKKSIGLLISGV